MSDVSKDVLLVAVATKGEGTIDLHFGHADDFSVYRVGADGARFLEVRPVVEREGEDKRDAVVRVLADCRALFAARVGDGPRAKLAKANIEPVDAYADAPVESSLQAWFAARA